VCHGSALGLTACGETIDLRDTSPVTSPDPGAVTGVDDPAGDDGTGATPVAADATLDEVLTEMLTEWRGLGERVIDNEAGASLARIEEGWAAIEHTIRTEHTNSYSGFQQAIDLARTSVERRRPADASKGYLVAVDLADEVRNR
jgi:hypothetical protein